MYWTACTGPHGRIPPDWVDDFTGIRKRHLKQNMGVHWSVGYSPEFMSSSYAEVWAVRESEGVMYYAAIEAEAKRGDNLCYGVYSKRGDTYEIPTGFRERLTAAIGRPARSNDIWPWFDYFDQDDRYWSDARVLLKMWDDCHSDPGEPRDSVAKYGDQLQELAEAVDRAIGAAS